MHPSAMRNMDNMLTKYFGDMNKGNILDVGSMIVADQNESYRNMIESRGWKYTGYDIEPGRNVDIVGERYSFPFKNDEFDLAISGNVIEHIEDIFSWVNEIKRVSSAMIIVAPNHRFAYHAFPMDYWRLMPDGMQYLLNRINMDILFCGYGEYSDDSEKPMNDIIGIGRKYNA